MPDGITVNAGGREYASSGARMIPPIPAQNRTGARAFALVMRWLVRIAALLTAAVLIFLIGYILVMGIPNLKPSLFEWTYNSENVSLVPALINTVLMTLFALVIATPLGIFAAVWLVEYAKRGNKLVKVVRVTTEEALLAVPDSYREGSFGLGAGKLRTVFTIVLPSAMPGILSGVILAVGRIVGETAALIYTASTVAAIPENVFSSTRTLAVHMYLLANEGLHVDATYGTAVVLLVLVLLINCLSSFIAGKLAKGK